MKKDLANLIFHKSTRSILFIFLLDANHLCPFQDNDICPPQIQPAYFLIRSDFPVISAGCSIPIISIKVGAMSAKHPPSLNV